VLSWSWSQDRTLLTTIRKLLGSCVRTYLSASFLLRILVSQGPASGLASVLLGNLSFLLACLLDVWFTDRQLWSTVRKTTHDGLVATGLVMCTTRRRRVLNYDILQWAY
jgi:hypothetical protein